MPFFKATNSAPNTNVSQIIRAFYIHFINGMFIYINNPVSLEYGMVAIKECTFIPLPIGLGMVIDTGSSDL